MGFYEQVAGFYDDMTRFEERSSGERDVLAAWVSRFGIRSALDAACGTGLHAILLAGMGVRSVGADLSPVMLDRAKEHARSAGAEVEWVEASMQEVARRAPGPFDAVLCLGNSLPHLLSPEDLAAALQSFRAVLAPGGVAVIQLLNYDRVLARRERIVGVHRKGDREFVRFYDFENRTLRFNILTLTWSGAACAHTLSSTTLMPYRLFDLAPALNGAGFSRVDAFGDMTFAPFDAGNSPNLVLVAS